MTQIQIDNADVFLRVEGSGEPILLLHGVPDSSNIWDKTIATLRHGYLCIAPDLPGFGRTKAPANFDYSLDNLAAFIDKLLVAQEITTPVNLVVHDIGGIVGLAWAARNPDKVKSLTIMSTVFFSDYEWHAMARSWRKPIVGELTMFLMGFKAFSQAMKRGARSFSDQQIRQSYDHLTLRNRRLILRFYRALNPEVFAGWEDELRRLTRDTPTQVIWGEADGFLPATLAKQFGSSNITLIDGCGHWAMQDETELVTEKIRALIATSNTPATNDQHE